MSITCMVFIMGYGIMSITCMVFIIEYMSIACMVTVLFLAGYMLRC